MAVMMRYWMDEDESAAVDGEAAVIIDDVKDQCVRGDGGGDGQHGVDRGEVAMLLRAYVNAVKMHVVSAPAAADDDTDGEAQTKEKIVELLVKSHWLNAHEMSDTDVAPSGSGLGGGPGDSSVQDIFAACKTLLRRPLTACRELATCVIGSIAKVLATSIGEAGAHDRPSDATSSLERLLQHVIESLSMAAADTSVSVRCYARAGLASIPRPGMHAQKNSYVMSLLSSCCDDESNDGIVAGLGGIGTIFSSLETQADGAGKAEAVDDSFSSLSPLQTAMRVRSCCFGSSNGRVREAALSTFETIIRATLKTQALGRKVADGDGWRSLVHDSLTKIVLLLNDHTSSGVRKAAKSLLRQCARVVEIGGGSEATPLGDLVSGPGFDADKRLQYQGFLKSLASVVCENYAEEVDGYLKHVMDECRRGSPMESNALLLGSQLLSRRVAMRAGKKSTASCGVGGDSERAAVTSFCDLLLTRLDSESNNNNSSMGGSCVDAKTRKAAAEALGVLMMDV